jgi:dihydropteroate synthase
MAIINGANIVRVHEVEQAVAMVNIVDAIRNTNGSI